MANIKFKGVHKSFGSNKIISDFNLEGKEDEFLVLVGPSGCGKSTLLRMIAGLEKIDEGEIFINDQQINELHPSKRQTAMVFQSYALYPHMNVFENMSFGLKIEKRPKEEILSKVTEAAKILKIEELLDRRPKELSGGQRQRVAIGRAITRNPKIFLFDEPLSNLDAALRAEMRVEISKLHNQIKTNMIYVTHDQVEAMTLADRIVILNRGNIEQVGTPEEIYNNPSNVFVAQFIGTPKMNILEIDEENIISENTLKLLGLEIKFNNIKFEKTKHFVGIRPEQLKVNDKNDFTFNSEVELIENLGNEKIVYIKKDKNQLSAKIPSNIEIIDKIGFNYKDLLIFDKNKIRIKI
jgi:multiple sugar transport system ATP-binding protein